ncbi:MAG TPA: ABC transporter permease [Acetobacteraceae bacterium]|jgi:peptide/nickel transport system permease protein|nr:ABC transporter permease [Acetobacteraceae bacterium]
MNATVLRLIITRLGLAALTLWIVSVLVFGATALLPGDVAEAVLGQAATPEAVAGLRAALHLDQPGWLRYLIWLGGLLHGDPGRSLVNHLPVAQLIGNRLPNSLLLAALTAAVSVPVALAIGITAAVRRGSLYDRVVNLLTVSLVSVPEFLVATLAVVIFAVNLHWLPALSSVSDISSPEALFRSFAMPVLSLSCVIVAQMARMSRAALIGTLDSSYVEMARLKGVRPARLVLRHALPNALGPIVNAVALSLSFLLGGVIIIETIFNYPGLAKLMVDAVATRDMPLVQACAMIFCAAYLLLTLLADIAAILSNPRLRHR